VIQGQDRRIHIVYTWNRRRIRHLTLAPDELRPLAQQPDAQFT
jgi:predicted neuraminidase